MSNIVIDIGNTYTKIAIFNEKQLIQKDIFLNSIFEADGISNYSSKIAERVIISNVGGTDTLKIGKLFSKSKVYLLNEGLRLPILNGYKTPEKLGSDRLCGVIGAHAIFPERNVLVIDSGTCITYDFISENGTYIGGSISPGLNTRLNSLHTRTRFLPLVEFEEIDYIIGGDTRESILTGVYYGILFEMEGFINTYHSKYSNLKVIMTGGDSIYFEKKLKSAIFAEPDLVLKGLNEILEFNT